MQSSTPVDPRKFATSERNGFKDKPEACVRRDLSADLLHAHARAHRRDYVDRRAPTVMVLTKEEPPAAH
jgi:hypothetical protein